MGKSVTVPGCTTTFESRMSRFAGGLRRNAAAAVCTTAGSTTKASTAAGSTAGGSTAGSSENVRNLLPRAAAKALGESPGTVSTGNSSAFGSPVLPDPSVTLASEDGGNVGSGRDPGGVATCGGVGVGVRWSSQLTLRPRDRCC